MVGAYRESVAAVGVSAGAVASLVEGEEASGAAEGVETVSAVPPLI